MAQAGGDPPVGAAAPATARKRASRSRVRAVVSGSFRCPGPFFAQQLSQHLAIRFPSIVTGPLPSHAAALHVPPLPSTQRGSRFSQIIPLFASFAFEFLALVVVISGGQLSSPFANFWTILNV